MKRDYKGQGGAVCVGGGCVYAVESEIRDSNSTLPLVLCVVLGRTSSKIYLQILQVK